jgi:hypothetical protein
MTAAESDEPRWLNGFRVTVTVAVMGAVRYFTHRKERGLVALSVGLGVWAFLFTIVLWRLVPPVASAAFKWLGPSGFGWLCFVLSLLITLSALGPTTCNDGWHSPSIGTQSACSWHGGVNTFPDQAAFLFSICLGYTAYRWARRRG